MNNGWTTYEVHGGWNAICDICGTKRKNHELTERWDGHYVCKQTINPMCWEQRHPQELIKPPRIEQPLPWTRPEGADTYVPTVCTVAGMQGIADYAIADCSICEADFGYRDA